MITGALSPRKIEVIWFFDAYSLLVMAKFIVEFHYYVRLETSFEWVYRRIGGKAEIREEDLVEARKRHSNVSITVERMVEKQLSSEPVFPIPHLITLNKTVIRILGDDEVSMKDSVVELLRLYGVPHDIVRGLWGARKAGKRIVESALKELGFVLPQ